MSIEETGLLLRRAQHRLQRAMDLAMAPLGVSFVQWSALREIARNPQSPQRRLAELTFNSDQAFGALSTRLEKAGWITRKKASKRAIHPALTAEGKAILAAGQKKVSEALPISFAPLNPKERDSLHALLTRLLE